MTEECEALKVLQGHQDIIGNIENEDKAGAMSPIRKLCHSSKELTATITKVFKSKEFYGELKILSETQRSPVCLVKTGKAMSKLLKSSESFSPLSISKVH